ncbi:hypothetical protein JCM11251_004113 [Rhodosporidiobolus azoricus]
MDALVSPFRRKAAASRALRIDLNAAASAGLASPLASPPLSPPSSDNDPFAPTSPLPPVHYHKRLLPIMLAREAQSAPPRLSSVDCKGEEEEDGGWPHRPTGQKRYRGLRRAGSAPVLLTIDEGVEPELVSSPLAHPPQTADFASPAFDLERLVPPLPSGLVGVDWSSSTTGSSSGFLEVASGPAPPFFPYPPHLLNSGRSLSPASPSFPFPRMPCEPVATSPHSRSSSPLKPARPQLVSAFTTCTTVRAVPGQWPRGSASGNSTPLYEHRTPISASTPPRGQDLPAKVASLPPTPPTTSPRRRRPPHLHLDSFASISRYTIDRDDDADEPSLSPLPPSSFPSSQHVIGEFEVDFLAEQEDLSLSALALDAFEDGGEFPWQWSSNGRGSSLSPPCASSPALLDSSSAARELPARRRMTLANGELARIQETLYDAALALRQRGTSTSSKRSAMYISSSSPCDDGVRQDQADSSASTRPLSAVSSTVTLSNLPYLPPSDTSLSSLRVGRRRPHHTACTGSPDRRYSSLPSSPPPTGLGLKSLRLTPGSPLSTSTNSSRAWGTPLEASFASGGSAPRRAPLQRLRSLSAPVPPRGSSKPSPTLSIPTQSGPDVTAEVPLSPAHSGWSSSSSSSTSSAPSSSLFRPHLPHFLPSSSVPAYPTTPSSSASFPTTSTIPVPIVLVPRPARVVSGQTVGLQADEKDRMRVLQEQLEAEKQRSSALDGEVRRLRRVVAVLTNMPLHSEEEE